MSIDQDPGLHSASKVQANEPEHVAAATDPLIERQEAVQPEPMQPVTIARLGKEATQQIVNGEQVDVASTRFQWTRGKKIAAAIVAVAGVGAAGAGVGVATSGGSNSSARKATVSRQIGNSSAPKAPAKPTHSPTSIATPEQSSTALSAGNLDPNTPIAVAYTGQPATVADVEKLMHNFAVSVTKDDPAVLTYSGIEPYSKPAESLAPLRQQYHDTETQAGPFEYQVFDKNVRFDSADPNKVTVVAGLGTAANFQYGTGAYAQYEMTLDHGSIALPNGETENIVFISSIDQVQQTTEPNWFKGVFI